jgi:hypothetical protein
LAEFCYLFSKDILSVVKTKKKRVKKLSSVEVVFCGRSLYLCGLATGLQQDGNFRVRIVDYAPEEAMPELKMLCPDVAIFEAGDHAAMLADSWRAAYPRLTIIAIQPESDSMQVFGNNDCFTAAVDDLARIIKELK